MIHASAVIDDGAQIGEGTRIWHFTHVCAGARIGASCTLGQNVYVAPTAVIGDRVKIQNNVSVYDGVILEDDVFVGPSAVFTNVANPRAEVSRKDAYQRTLISTGATIGANATILCGRTLGRYAFVAAGAVVTYDVAPFALVAGVPRAADRLDVPVRRAHAGSAGRLHRLQAHLPPRRRRPRRERVRDRGRHRARPRRRGHGSRRRDPVIPLGSRSWVPTPRDHWADFRKRTNPVEWLQLATACGLRGLYALGNAANDLATLGPRSVTPTERSEDP
jgi:UDP-2-acetamido-3-amino-2,3-dideoxy-glucuronate N-acetyltransferase